jgi:ribosomal-protein-alanine N-acetyltransferase
MSAGAALATRFTPMALDDVPFVGVLEPLCFPSPWSQDTYRHEISRNQNASYWVLRPDPGETRTDLPPILAYGGYWLLGDEAHIVTIATHPEFRRRGLAEHLLCLMIERAQAGGATDITLEVRMTNTAAQRMYEKLGFVKVGMRKEYYRDNREDALLMTLFLPRG